MKTRLERTLSEVRAQIHRARISLVSDERRFLDHNDCVRTQLLNPVLTALGWNVHDPNEVRTDFTLEGRDADSCLALFVFGTPRLLVDFRGLGQECEEESVLNDLVPLACEAGFEWVILTDGDVYDVYNAHEGLPRAQRPFDSVRLSVDPLKGVLELFHFLSKEEIEGNSIDSEWRSRVIDQEVADALKHMLDSRSRLVQLLAGDLPNFTAQDIEGSLSRARVNIEFLYREPDIFVNGRVSERAAGMSEAELHIATWLQQRSIERWARGGAAQCRIQSSQRRMLAERRLNGDRRSGLKERRVARVAIARERRTRDDRRRRERRSNVERRQISDRRCACRRV